MIKTHYLVIYLILFSNNEQRDGKISSRVVVACENVCDDYYR